MTYIELRTNYDNSADELRGRQSKLYPWLAVLIINGHVSGVMQVTSKAQALRELGDFEIRKV